MSSKTQCECLTKKGTRCTKNAKGDSKRCHVHASESLSKKFKARFSTLVHAISEDISKRIPKFHIECDEEVCYYCKENLSKYTRTRDHIVNLVENSWFNRLTNLTNATVPCCRGCNQKKGKKKVDVPFQVTEEYVFEKEEELRELVTQLKDIMNKIQTLIHSSPIVLVDQARKTQSYNEHIL